MASRGFTVRSLQGGGRWARTVPTGSDTPEMQSLVPPRVDNCHFVHDSAVIGDRTSSAALLLENEVEAALDRYIVALKGAYTCQGPGTGGKVPPVDICKLYLFSPGEIQPIVRQYLAVKKAVQELIDVRADEAEIDAPFERLSVKFSEGGKSDCGDGKCFPRSATRAFMCCMVFSLLLGVGALVVSGVYYALGSEGYADDAKGGLEAGTFWDGNFWGWPSEKVVRNIWCGLMLGLVFGFLDNFGLFYGSGALDCTFYSIGNKLASGLLADTPNANLGQDFENDGDMRDTEDLRKLALTAHSMTEDMMSGLGNTFSGARQPLPYGTPLADAVQLAACCLRRPSGRCARHGRARNRQGRAGSRAVVVARRLAGHCAWLLAGRLPAGVGQVQEACGLRQLLPLVQVRCRARRNGQCLSVGHHRWHSRRPQSRRALDHLGLARHDRPCRDLPRRRGHLHSAHQCTIAHAQAAVGCAEDAGALPPHVHAPEEGRRQPCRHGGQEDAAAVRASVYLTFLETA